MTTLNDQCLPHKGSFLINHVLFPYKVGFGPEYAQLPNFYRVKKADGHALLLTEGIAEAQTLLAMGQASGLAMAGTRSIPIGRSRIADVRGTYLLAKLWLNAKASRSTILFITPEGYLHQHYETNHLDETALQQVYVDFAEKTCIELAEETTRLLFNPQAFIPVLQ